jgi:hypothetical protein
MNNVLSKESNINNINNKVNTNIKEELKREIKPENESEINKSIYDIYSDFNWLEYRRLNPYLYFIGLRTEEEYIQNYLIEGRYKGRVYKELLNKPISIHVLIATIGKLSIFNVLGQLQKQLFENDFLTIVFDGINNSVNSGSVKKFCENFKCTFNIIIEYENLGYWGHGIRNKYKDLRGDFIYHIDDDDSIYNNTFDIIRYHCKDLNTIYIFKIMLENNTIVWKEKIIKHAQISTQSGVIPMHMNKNGFFGLFYGGDYEYYNNLSKKYNILFIDKIIYKKNK